MVPFQAGSSVDVIARALTQGLATELGEPVVIDNRPGAGAIIGTAYVARAEPDGYTMLLATGPHTSQPSVAKDLPYDPIRDFAPITQIAASCGLVMLTNMQVKAHSVADIVALAKADPGKVTYATPRLRQRHPCGGRAVRQARRRRHDGGALRDAEPSLRPHLRPDRHRLRARPSRRSS